MVAERTVDFLRLWSLSTALVGEMSIFLLVRAVSDRFIDAAEQEPELAFALLDNGAPPPEWHVNAVRDHARRQEVLAKAGVSLEADAGELHDLGGSWDGLTRTLEALGNEDANVFAIGIELGDDEEAGIRALTSTETDAALATLETLDRAAVETAIRRALDASRSVREQRRNPFTGEVQSAGTGSLCGVGGATDDEIVVWWTESFHQLRAILREACDRRFGLALQIVL